MAPHGPFMLMWHFSRRKLEGGGGGEGLLAVAPSSRAHTYNYFLLLFDGWMFLGVNGADDVALWYAVFRVLNFFSRETRLAFRGH